MDKTIIENAIVELYEYEMWLDYLYNKGNPKYKIFNKQKLRRCRETIKQLENSIKNVA